MARYLCAARTDVGMKREHNEDSFLVNEALGLYVVCDGMGGHAGGETASRLAVLTIERELLASRLRADDPYKGDPSLEEDPLASALREAIEGACAAVYRASVANPELAKMGTTCIALLVKGSHAFVGHVGDSRAYLCRGDRIWQLSEDHSLVNEQMRAGLLTPEDARHSRLKNIITRSVGYEEDVLVDLMGIETHPKDKVLLCSDGLTNLVDAQEIRATFEEGPIEGVPATLIRLANSRGGDDNVTVIVVERLE